MTLERLLVLLLLQLNSPATALVARLQGERELSSSGDGSSPNRRIGEIAAMVSAVTAVIGLLLAVFGVPFTGGSPVNRSVVGGAGTPNAPASTPQETRAASSPATTVGPGPAPSASPQPSPSTMAKGWHRVSEPKLTVAFAVPDGWIQERENDIQSNWRSPDEAHRMSVKRDTSYGSTVQTASAGQLAWYRDTDKSSMADVKVVTHTTQQNGQDALWLEIDYHWAGQSEPRKRVEVFVAGKAGDVYQLLFDTASSPEKLATQMQLFATARAHLLIDMTATS
ncbi:hypothetical protein [Streptomyces sp. NPDC050263]|uniref:hypothetical protein n=1 Tax=Streptomyces sp. NPDC050263 TaxID=3155037 RepID=UPI00343E7052